MNLLRLVLVLSSAVLVWSAAAAEENEAMHNELRALRGGLLEAINSGDIARQLPFLHPDVVVTWHNAEVSRGRDGVRAYYDRMVQGPEKMVEKFTAELTVDELTILHGGDTGISFGGAEEHFTLTNGSEFVLHGRWTATLVRENGQWLVASLHVSSNVFDNVVLDVTKKYAKWIAGILCAVGALFGWLLGRRRRRVVVA